MDPAELRRRNYLTAADLPYELGMPYRDGNPLVYDSGDFRPALEAALSAPSATTALRARAGARCARGASIAASASRATSRAPPSAPTRARR